MRKWKSIEVKFKIGCPLRSISPYLHYLPETQKLWIFSLCTSLGASRPLRVCDGYYGTFDLKNAQKLEAQSFASNHFRRSTEQWTPVEVIILKWTSWFIHREIKPLCDPQVYYWPFYRKQSWKGTKKVLLGNHATEHSSSFLIIFPSVFCLRASLLK